MDSSLGEVLSSNFTRIQFLRVSSPLVCICIYLPLHEENEVCSVYIRSCFILWRLPSSALSAFVGIDACMQITKPYLPHAVLQRVGLSK